MVIVLGLSLGFENARFRTRVFDFKTRVFADLSLGAIGPYELAGKSVWTNVLFTLFSGKFVSTNGAESSSKVSL